jgi:hypothetical protein
MIQELQPSCAPHTVCTVKRLDSHVQARSQEAHISHRVYLISQRVELDFLSHQPLHDAFQFLGFCIGDATPAKTYDSYGSAF